MLADIMRQPAVLAGLAQRGEAFARLGAKHLKPGPGGRIFVSGCGDGLFAAEASGAFAASSGLDWRPMGALDLVLSAHRLTAQDRVLCISMSGNVDRTVEAAVAVAAAGVPLLALVNGEGGKLGTIAAAKLSLDLPDIAPFLCGTASYTATIAALMLLAAGAGSSASPDLASAARAQSTVFAASRSAIEQLGARVPSGLRVLSAGADMGSARYGAAKFVELSRIPAWAADLEEFAHSQYWSMPTSDLVVMIAAEGILAGYAQASAAALSGLPTQTLVIESEAHPVTSAQHRVTIPVIAPELTPLVTPIPLQMLAYQLSLASGLEPNTRLHLKNDMVRFAVSRELTRRSLLGTGR